MEIKQLESFVTACERGSLSQAAACMYTTQPNVSKTIRTLEHELGRPLLVRSGKGVQPTVYGKNVLEYAKLILRATATISSLAVPDEQNGLRLSAYPSNMVSRLLVDFYKTWGSGIHIEHHEGTVRRSPTMSTKEFLKLESYMWRKSRCLHFSTFFSTRNWSLFRRVKRASVST